MFAIRNLSVHCDSNGLTLWSYKTKDILDDIGAPNYFDDAFDMLTKGDTILVSAADGGRMLSVRSVGRESAVVEPLK